MATKNVQIFVSDSGLDTLVNGKDFNSFEFNFNQVNRFKHGVALTVSYDREVKITESEFDKAWSENQGTNWAELRSKLKEVLFKNA